MTVGSSSKHPAGNDTDCNQKYTNLPLCNRRGAHHAKIDLLHFARRCVVLGRKGRLVGHDRSIGHQARSRSDLLSCRAGALRHERLLSTGIRQLQSGHSLQCRDDTLPGGDARRRRLLSAERCKLHAGAHLQFRDGVVRVGHAGRGRLLQAGRRTLRPWSHLLSFSACARCRNPPSRRARSSLANRETAPARRGR